ncbi:acyl-homoserine-lactone synthase [Paraburkholderia kururiensis]|jgi:acyl homoserine lactone synthase|uniref:acyl-homoserine-lactone synthase n=1 Tax=Paraburkholderia kururiensis TaxID=984307 RepID=UPI0018F7BD27|nr:acyl-homoserine-lactone synthase [Paraburkholderia kururiensis]
MPSVLAGKTADLPPEIHRDLGRFRYEVFVRRLGWSLPDIKDDTTAEWDRFDVPDTVHVIALTAGRQVCGCARLIPTTGPHLLEDLLAGASNLDLPSSPTVWELSRFASSGIDPPDATAGMHLFPYALAVATSLGATRIVGVVTHAVARLYRRFGLVLESAGSTAETSGLPFLVCALDLSPLTFDRLGLDFDNLLTSVTWLGPRKRATPGDTGDTPCTDSTIDGRAPPDPDSTETAAAVDWRRRT